MRILLPAIIFVLSGCVSGKINKSARYLTSNPLLQNAHVGIAIYDAEAGKYLYQYQSDKYFVPASNIKIPTCYAAMKYLGDSLVNYRYVVEGDNIYIDPAGDPLFLHASYPYQKGFEFLKRFKKVHLNITGFNNFLGSGWSWNDYRESYMAQRSDLPLYGNIVRFSWSDRKVWTYPRFFSDSILAYDPLPSGFRVQKPWDTNQFTILPGTGKSDVIPFRPGLDISMNLMADTLGIPLTAFSGGKSFTSTMYSFHTDSMLKPMMHRSDNFFAEQSLVMAAREFTGEFDLPEMIDTILKTDFAGLTQMPRWVDGSGLSRYNLFTPESFIGILLKMQQEFGMERIKEIFPTGDDGTLSGLYKNYSGRIFAKTGTLSGVVALSGFIYSKNNRLLVFSVLVNNHRSVARDIRVLVQDFLVEMAERN